MMMTEYEIVNSFLESADKRKQIKILSELNACTEEKIVAILEEDGRVKKNMLHAWKISKGRREQFQKKQEERRQMERELVAQAEHKAQMDVVSTPEETPAAPPQENSETAFGALLEAYAAMWGYDAQTLQRIAQDMEILRDMARRAGDHRQAN